MPGGTFAAVGPSQDATGRSLSVAAATFADWTVSAAVALQPVSLVAFSAERAGTAARLRWATASEVNSAWFEPSNFANAHKVVAWDISRKPTGIAPALSQSADSH